MRAFTAGLAIAFLLTGRAEAVSDYTECVNLATIDPEQTLVDARAWNDATGSLAALHCMAIAQGELGAHRTAANTLMNLANAAGLDDAARIEALIDASRQWTLAGRGEAARSTIDAALRVGVSRDALVERSAFKKNISRGATLRSPKNVSFISVGLY